MHVHSIPLSQYYGEEGLYISLATYFLLDLKTYF